MIDAQGFDAFVKLVLLVDSRQALHLDVKLQRDAPRILRAQHAVHMRAIHPFRGQAARFEKGFGLVQIGFVKQLEGQAADIGDVRFHQAYAVMPAFFHRAESDTAIIFIGDLQAQRVCIKCPRRSQIGDTVVHVTETQDIERRIKICGGDGHVSAPV